MHSSSALRPFHAPPRLFALRRFQTRWAGCDERHAHLLDLERPGQLLEASLFRISRNGHEPIIDLDQVEAIKPAIRSSKPGRYHVDEISADPLSSGHTSRRWGIGIKRADGSVELEPVPWPESHEQA